MLLRKTSTHIALFILILICFQTASHAQLNAVTIGSASDLGNNCFRITPDQLNLSGGAWYDNPINFSNDFTIFYENNFGTKDGNGADGMALVFKTNATAVIGGTGGGIGYEGISNSMIVEFDTYENGGLGDPTVDHIGIMSNGVPNHSSSSSLAGPIQASSTSGNIEDGIDHNIKIVWTASSKTLEVYFDCILRLSVTKDVKTDIFGGDSSVFFGFVGSTGGLSNLHQVCFNRISFVDNFNLVDTAICSGETVQLDATIPSGVTYSWSPTTGVSNPSIANPILSPTSTTTYTVTINDVCGDSITEDVLITINPSGTSDFTQIDPICEGSGNPLTSTSINGITGAWSPAFNPTATTTYTFTPDAGQCASTATMTITVNPIIAPTFNLINSICIGDTLTPLQTTSNEGVIGSWSPALDSTTTTTYTFMPSANQCANTSTTTITVNPIITPSFNPINSICDGDTLAPLPATSNEGITGNWSPALDNTITTTYAFTPDIGQCAIPSNLMIVVVPNSLSTFTQILPICEGDSLTLPTTSIEGFTGTWSPVFDNTTSDTYTFTPDAGQCASTATMSIIVIPIMTPTFTQVATICVGDVLMTLPTVSNNGFSGTWSPAINNTITTEYTFTATPVTGSCFAETKMTISVLTQTIPLFTQVDPICIGSVLAPLPTTSNGGITGDWSPALDNLATTLYTFTPDAGQCADATTMTIVVNPISILTIDATKLSEDFDANQIISVSATGGSGTYEYQLDGGVWQSSSTFEYVVGCQEHTVAVRDVLGCSTTPEARVMIMEFPKFFTPNGDGYNDTWNIKCLRDDPTALISIFDRFGKLLFQFKPNQNAWNGVFNGSMLPATDYWFVVNYLKSNDVQTEFRSHFSLRH